MHDFRSWIYLYVAMAICTSDVRIMTVRSKSYRLSLSLCSSVLSATWKPAVKCVAIVFPLVQLAQGSVCFQPCTYAYTPWTWTHVSCSSINILLTLLSQCADMHSQVDFHVQRMHDPLYSSFHFRKFFSPIYLNIGYSLPSEGNEKTWVLANSFLLLIGTRWASK